MEEIEIQPKLPETEQVGEESQVLNTEIEPKENTEENPVKIEEEEVDKENIDDLKIVKKTLPCGEIYKGRLTKNGKKIGFGTLRTKEKII